MATIGGHPIHPMLVVFPIGLWVFSFCCDLMCLVRRGSIWRDVASDAIGGGLVGGIAAAIHGFIDYLSIHWPQVHGIAPAHMTMNLSRIGLFAVDLALRAGWPRYVGPAATISVIGVLLLVVSGWLGGEMVFVDGVAVRPHTSVSATAGDQAPALIGLARQ